MRWLAFVKDDEERSTTYATTVDEIKAHVREVRDTLHTVEKNRQEELTAAKRRIEELEEECNQLKLDLEIAARQLVGVDASE